MTSAARCRRSIFVIFRSHPGATAALKVLLKRYRLRCVSLSIKRLIATLVVGDG